MDKILRLNTEQRESLVAYLDGELDETAAQEIEHVLAQSAVARHDVEALTRTWELLDVLPQAKATEGFTDRTLASLNAAELRQPISEQSWFQRTRKGVILAGWVIGLSASAAFGFLITNRWIPNETQQMIEQYPILKNLDTYDEIDDIQFLRELRKSGLFNEDAEQNQP